MDFNRSKCTLNYMQNHVQMHTFYLNQEFCVKKIRNNDKMRTINEYERIMVISIYYSM